MDTARKRTLYRLPVLLLLLPALLGVFWEIYNRHYRGIGTPFLYPSVGLILLSLFFWARRRWMYGILVGIISVYLFFLFKNALLEKSFPPSVVHYYRHWALDTQTGLLKLYKPIGPHPPVSGAYVSCLFSLNHWFDFFRTQPTLCTGFDEQHRLQMTLNDGEGEKGPLREFQLNFFTVDRKSLLGEPLDRWALRLAFQPVHQGLFPRYQIKRIYQVFEREMAPGKNKIVESFSRDEKGELQTFTEAPMLIMTHDSVYALYGPDGGLMEIPQRAHRNYSFPAKIDIRHYENYNLPNLLGPDETG